MSKIIFFVILSLISFSSNYAYSNSQTLLHVSYDSTRELYHDINVEFIRYLKGLNMSASLKQSHSGSAKQARSVADGLEADIVSLANSYDVDMLVSKKLINPNWQELYPNKSCPLKSTIVFLVRKHNPKNIKDWDDLVQNHVSIVTPNPKTSGGAKWNYIAAWYSKYRINQNEEEARDFVHKLYKNAKILDNAARASTISFVKRNIGDVLITWENEAYLALKEFGASNFEIIIPSTNIEIDLPVTIVTKFAEKHHTKDIAGKYVEFLFSEQGQKIIEKHYFRPVNIDYSADKNFVPIKNFISLNLDNEFYHKHFDNKGVFDQIYEKK